MGKKNSNKSCKTEPITFIIIIILISPFASNFFLKITTAELKGTAIINNLEITIKIFLSTGFTEIKSNINCGIKSKAIKEINEIAIEIFILKDKIDLRKIIFSINCVLNIIIRLLDPEMTLEIGFTNFCAKVNTDNIPGSKLNKKVFSEKLYIYPVRFETYNTENFLK